MTIDILTSQKSSTMPVTICDTVKDRLNYLNGTLGLSWRAIANLDDYKPIPAGSLCRFVKDGYLADKWRVRLGIPTESRVQVVFGYVPDGSQVLAADQCECHRWYISNNSARKSCFICSPYRGKRSKA